MDSDGKKCQTDEYIQNMAEPFSWTIPRSLLESYRQIYNHNQAKQGEKELYYSKKFEQQWIRSERKSRCDVVHICRDIVLHIEVSILQLIKLAKYYNSCDAI